MKLALLLLSLLTLSGCSSWEEKLQACTRSCIDSGQGLGTFSLNVCRCKPKD